METKQKIWRCVRCGDRCTRGFTCACWPETPLPPADVDRDRAA